MKKYLIFDLDGTLLKSDEEINTLIYNYIKKNIDPELIDTARYLIENNQWMSIKETMTTLIDDKNDANKHYLAITWMIDDLQDQVKFFDWVQDKIKELSLKYTLFLSTWNSDKFANEMLSHGWVDHCFHKILWSSFILKSPEHIDELATYSWDDDFYDKAVFIWDWQRDRFIAKSKNIDFIHIWSENIDTYEIQTVTQIDTILEQF